MDAASEPEPEPEEDAREQAAALPETDDPHVLLGVAPGAGLEATRQAFRRLALLHHPDKGGSSADFQRLRAAAEALLGAAAGETGGPSCVAPARGGRDGGGAAQQQQQPALPLPAQHAGWRMAEATNGMGYTYLCIIHSQSTGPCIALHQDSLGGFQYRRRRPEGAGWYDAEAFADGGGTKVSGMMVSMVGIGRCAAVAEDGREGMALEGGTVYVRSHAICCCLWLMGLL